MPVVLSSDEEIETWLRAPAAEALALQRPLPDGALTVVAWGEKQDSRSGHLEPLALSPSRG